MTDQGRNRIDADKLAEYGQITNPASADYEHAIAPALAERDRVTNEAWAEGEPTVAEAPAEYKRIPGS